MQLETSVGSRAVALDDNAVRVAFSPFGLPAPSSQIELNYRPRCQIARAVYGR